jgi:hypothetical protein
VFDKLPGIFWVERRMINYVKKAQKDERGHFVNGTE